MHLALDSHGMPVRLAVTEGTVADCSQALPLIEGISTQCLLAGKFLEFKQWRVVATRYAKRTASHLAACQLRAVMIWSKLF